jgi:hypothetical protein
MPRLHGLTLLAAAVLLSLPAAAVGSRPAAALACGILPYTEAVVNGTSQRTTSRAFVDVVGSSLRFRTKETSCIVVRFSAQVMALGDGSVRTMQVRAVRNDGRGDVLSPDGPIQFVVGPVADARSFGLLLPAVPPGLHTVRMQFRSGDGSVVVIKSLNMNVSRGR